MKKALTIVGSLALIIGVFSAQAFAHGGARGHGQHGWHGKKHAQVYRGVLLPPTGATGATGATSRTVKPRVSRHAGKHRSRHGQRAWASGPIGGAQWVQNSTRFSFKVGVKNLAPSTTYNVAIYGETDGQGCASTTNTALSAPTVPPLTTDTRGKGKTKVSGAVADASLDKATKYYVKVADSSGATVLCGKLYRFGKYASHWRGCGFGLGGARHTSGGKHH